MLAIALLLACLWIIFYSEAPVIKKVKRLCLLVNVGFRATMKTQVLE